jgi:NADPH-dependent ferric siderophore reductase
MVDQPARPTTEAVVARVEQLTPHMVRVVVGGEALRRVDAGSYTDHYLKVLFPRPGVDYPEPFDLARIRATMPPPTWPAVRTYTIRRWLPEIPEMWVDFVVHGDEGVAGPWATRVAVGEPFRFLGPGGGYAPDPAADWHLLAGDESALPAIAAALHRMPPGARAYAFLEVADADEEQKLDTVADAEITWLHRDGAPVGARLVPAVRGFGFPAGQPQAFVHGEAGLVRELRGYLRTERGIPLDRLSISGYWRRGLNEDGWRSAKRAWNQQVEREQDGTRADRR